MGYWEGINWDALKKDVQKGIEEGIVVLKRGAMVAQKKAGELTDEGKRRYQVLELKTKIHKHFYDLGGRVYALAGSGRRAADPLADAEVKGLISRIRGLERKVAALEGTAGKRPARTAGRKKA